MRRLTKVALVWAVLAWLATTWIGAVLGFLCVWVGIMLVAAIVVALGADAQTSLPDPTLLLWGLWAMLLALALARLAAARADPRRREEATALVISLFGLVVVVTIALDTMKSSWPRG